MSKLPVPHYVIPMPVPPAPALPHRARQADRYVESATYPTQSKTLDPPDVRLRTPIAPTVCSRRWPKYTQVRVAFLNGTKEQQDIVKKHADEWIRLAPAIEIVWVSGIQGDVRVAFSEKDLITSTLTLKSDGSGYGSDYSSSGGGSYGYDNTYGSADYGSTTYDVSSPDDPTIIDKYPILKEYAYPPQWSYIGTDSLGAISTPETIRLTGIPCKAGDALTDRLIVLHGFGHVLGLDFAECVPADPWRNVSAALADQQLSWLNDDVATFLSGKTILDNPALLGKDNKSIMLYNFKDCDGLSDGDRRWVSALYGIGVKDITFNLLKDLDMKSKKRDNDLEVYVLSDDNVIYQNTRQFDNGNITWAGWTRLARGPFDAKSIVVCPLSDRTDIFVITVENNVRYKYRKPGEDWKTVGHLKVDKNKGIDENKAPIYGWGRWTDKNCNPHTVSDITAIENEGGYELFITGRDNELGHVSRQPTHLPLEPSGPYPINDSAAAVYIDNTLVDKNTKLFVATNPEALKGQSRVHSIDKKDGWSVAKMGPNIRQEAVTQELLNTLDPTKTLPIFNFKGDQQAYPMYADAASFAVGCAATTQHIFVVDNQFQFHHNSNPDPDSNWPNWDTTDENLTPPPDTLTAVAAGNAPSNNDMNDYVHVFAVGKTDGRLYYNYVDRDNKWQNPGSDDPECDHSWKTYKINATDLDPCADKKLRIPFTVERVSCATSQSGDLEVFAISKPDRFIFRLRLGRKGAGMAAWESEWSAHSWWN